jgi:predicted amidohydrolase YtcJ
MTVAETQARIQACLDRTAEREEPDGLLRVSGWYFEAMLPDGVHVDKTMLDALDTERPIIVSNRDGHTSLVNSRALELAGITAATPDPPDGRIERDAQGNPTGFLADGARNGIKAGPTAPPPVVPDGPTAARIALKALNEQGVTSFREASSGESSLSAFEGIRQAGDLTARVFGSPRISGPDAAKPDETVARVASLIERFDHPAAVTPTLKVSNVKIFNDGVEQYPSQTAAMLEPYLVNAGTHEHPNWVPGTHSGQPFIDREVLKTLTLKLAKRGIGSHVHAIGDRAVREVLDAYEHVRRNTWNPSLRLSIAHAENVDPADFGRFAQWDVSPVMSFQWAKPGPNMIDALADYLGEVRLNRIEPMGSLLAAGTNVVYGSDWPVDPLDEWFAMQVGITRMTKPTDPYYEMGRLGTDPGLPVNEAIKAFTRNAAYDLGQERTTGTIERGKYADMIVIDRNLLEIEPTDITDTKVLMTMVGGKVVYEADGWPSASR